jgi:hypothetical protein
MTNRDVAALETARGVQVAGESETAESEEGKEDEGPMGLSGPGTTNENKENKKVKEAKRKKGKKGVTAKDHTGTQEGDPEKTKPGKFAFEKGKKLTEDSGEDEAWHDWKNEHSDDNHIKEMKNHLQALEHDRDYERKDAEYDHDDYEDDRKDESKQKTLNEDSGEEEAWNDWKNEHADDDHIKELEHHLRALKEDRDYEEKGAEYDDDKYEDEGYDDKDKEDGEEEDDEEAEIVEFAESFFPKGRSIRQKARIELNEALMERWSKIIK